MTNNIKVIFDNSDLLIQENLTSNNMKVVFGVKDNIIPPSTNCDNNWSDLDGDTIDLDCDCSEPWTDITGNDVNLDITCVDRNANCDFTWTYQPPGDPVDFDCLCVNAPSDSNDFSIDCSKEDNSNLGRFIIDAGESVSFELHGLEIYTATAGEKFSSSLDIRHTVLDFASIYGGEYLDLSIYRDRELDSTIIDGPKFVPDIKFAPTALLDVNFTSGESIYNELSIISTFTSDSSIGENIVIDLQDYPFAKLESTVYDGQSSDISLTTNRIFESASNIGENIVIDLQDYPFAKLESTVYDGQSSDIVLTTNKIFDVGVIVGEQTQIDLFLPYNPYIEFNANINGEGSDVTLSTESIIDPYNFNQSEVVDVTMSTQVVLDVNKFNTGEYSTVTFYESVNHELSFNVDVGEKLNDFNLSTNMGFIVNAYEGQLFKSNIDYDPYTGFPAQVDAGEGLDISIYRNRLFYPDNINHGEYVDAIISTYEYYKIQSNSNIGEYVNVVLSTDVRLEEFYASSGEKINFVLDELSNYEISSGETVDVQLATDASLQFESYPGESYNVSIKTGDPVNIGFTAYSGETYSPDVKILRSYNLIAEFTVGERVYVDDWINEPLIIDLDERKCCDILLGDLNYVELDLAPYNHTRYETTFGTCELVTFELSSRRALSFDASTGEGVTWNNNLNTMIFTAYEGHTSVVSNFKTIPTIDLDEGNPDLENPVVDIDRPDIKSEFEYIMFGSAESVNAVLSMSYELKNPVLLQGEEVYVDIVTSPPFRFVVDAGEHCSTVLNTDIKLSNTFTIGNEISAKFYEPPYDVYSGEYMSVELETKADYYAEFVTEGCLNNDYQDVDPETGQPIPQEYNGTSVEGEMFSKYIEGRCF